MIKRLYFLYEVHNLFNCIPNEVQNAEERSRTTVYRFQQNEFSQSHSVCQDQSIGSDFEMTGQEGVRNSKQSRCGLCGCRGSISLKIIEKHF